MRISFVKEGEDMDRKKLIRHLVKNDYKVITRDRFLLLVFVLIVFIAAVLKFGLPWLNIYLAEHGILPNPALSKSLSDFYPMIIASFVLFQGGLLAGTILGFACIDEKEDNTIKALLTSPLSLNFYVFYRIVLATVFAFLTILFQFLFINLAAVPSWQMIILSLAGSLAAPIILLFYAIFAQNKVQGFAMSKFAGIAGWVIMFGWFVSEPWQWLFGLFPPFWISKAYWMILDGNSFWWVSLTIGIIMQCGLIYLFARLFKRVVYLVNG